VDGLGNKVYKLKEPRIIRTSDPHPASQSGAFFYEMLLHHAPFDDETEIIPADGNYFAGELHEAVQMHACCTWPDMEQP
jgi:hypothetical protein